MMYKVMLSRNFLCLFLHSVIFLYDFVVIVSFGTRFTDEIITKELESVVEELKPLQNFKFCYLTCWNFVLQLIFLCVTILDETALIFHIRHYKVWRLCHNIRTYLFFTIIFPLTLLVAVSFWTMFLYNRDLVFPEVLDKIVPLWMNHSMHTIIVLPLIIEILTQNVKNYRIKFKNAIKPLLSIVFLYNIVFVGIYLFHGIWLYKMFYTMRPIQIILVFILFYFLVIVFVYFGINLQKVKIKRRFRYNF